VYLASGSEGLIASYEEAAKTAEEIGYPVMIKATAGGGEEMCVPFGKPKT
jgi:biotin carboxylase